MGSGRVRVNHPGFVEAVDDRALRDVALVEGVQVGAASGALADGQLLGATEGLIAAVQAHVRAHVEPALDGAG